jgi:hypothetical protein
MGHRERFDRLCGAKMPVKMTLKQPSGDAFSRRRGSEILIVVKSSTLASYSPFSSYLRLLFLADYLAFKIQRSTIGRRFLQKTDLAVSIRGN